MREAMEKILRVGLIKRKEVRGDDPIKYFLLTGSEVLFESQRSDDSLSPSE